MDASLNSDAETTWIGVGTAFTDAGRPREAIGALKRALAIRESAAVYNNLGLAYRAAGNRPEARRYLQLALDLDPNLPATRRVLGSLCEQMGDSAAAIEHLQIASALEPETARAHAELGRVLSAHGRIPEAIEQLRVATSLEAAAFDAANNLAWILATAPDQQVRNPEEAVELARHVCEAVDSSSAMLPAALDTLAAAYAAAGHFDLAVDSITKAIDLARSRHSDPMALEMEQRRRLYVTQSPYTDDSLKAK